MTLSSTDVRQGPFPVPDAHRGTSSTTLSALLADVSRINLIGIVRPASITIPLSRHSDSAYCIPVPVHHAIRVMMLLQASSWIVPGGET